MNAVDFMIFHFSYAGITRIRLLGYNLSPCFKAPPKEKYHCKNTKLSTKISPLPDLFFAKPFFTNDQMHHNHAIRLFQLSLFQNPRL